MLNRKIGLTLGNYTVIVCLLWSIFAAASTELTEGHTFTFDIPNQPLIRSLNELSNKTETLILFPYDLVENLPGSSVRGSYTAKEALDLLLKNTDLVGGVSEEGVLTISKNNSYETDIRERQKMNSKKTLLASLMGLLSIGGTSAAQAADNSEKNSAIEEVIVTAQRRAENLQDVPISISAFGDEAITRSDINSISKLGGQVPGMVVALGAERMNISVRGIGSTITNMAAEAGVPVNIDGVYMTRVTLTGATYADLNQIEVLRGPQGTLYGRNATGGTVNIWTKEPDGSFGGEVSTLAGNGGRFRVRGAVGLPLDGERLSARIGFDYEDLDGYRENVFLGEDADSEEHRSARAVLRWAPSDKFEALFRASISSDDTGGPNTQYGQYIGGPFSPLLAGGLTTPDVSRTSIDPTRIRADQKTSFEFEDEIYSATLTWELEDTTFKSVTAYQSHKMDSTQDADGTSYDYAVVEFIEDSPAVTQEVTWSGSTSAIDWLVGAWAMDDEANSTINFHLPAVGAPDFSILYKQETRAYALFTQATYRVSDAFRTTFGLRYSDEEKTFTQSVGFPPPSICNNEKSRKSYDDLSPKITLDYDLADNVMIYASATKGFKAGGGNTAVCGATYDPETLWAYEAGVKSQWLDDRLRFNLNAYYYDYEGYQSSQIVPPASAIITNAADAEVQGLELELKAELARGLTFDLGMALADSEFIEFLASPQLGGPPVDVSGNSLVASPEFSGNAAIQYETPIGNAALLSLRIEHSWNDGYFLDVYNSPAAEQGSFGLTNARLSYGFESGSMQGLEASLYVNNIEDEDVLIRADVSGVFGGSRLAYGTPKTYGIELRYRFGQ